jgi:RTA1 like protein
MTLICSGAPQSVNTKNNSGQRASGKALLKAALLLQLAVMVFLVSVAARWQWNCRRRGKLLFTAQGGERRNIKRVLSTLYCSCALITCCIIFRTVEYFEYSSFTASVPGVFLDTSSVSPVIRYEWFFWVFDATVILCNSALWSVRHPARDLPRSERTYLAEDGTERQGSAIEDIRRCWAKVLDPFDIWGLVMGYHEKWWEVGVEDTSTRGGAHLEE